jgi:pilus assembly protein CpaE
MSVQGETDYMRKAMLAGARDFLTKPFSLDELLSAVHNARKRQLEMPVAPAGTLAAQPSRIDPFAPAAPQPGDKGAVIAVYSPKGGAGTTTIAVNVALQLARQRYATILVDGSLQFGDVGVMLNLKPVATIMDLVERSNELEHELVSSVATSHRSGLKILTAPTRPEMAEAVRPSHMETLLNYLRQHFTYIVVDTSKKLDDVNLAILDQADRILLVIQPELPAIKNASRFLDLANDLKYPREKVILVVNEVVDRQGIGPMDIAKALKRPSPLVIPADEREARQAINQGDPLVIGRAHRRQVAAALRQVADRVVAELEASPEDDFLSQQKRRPSIFARLFGRT